MPTMFNPEVQSAIEKQTQVCIKICTRYAQNPEIAKRLLPLVFKKYCVKGRPLKFVLRAYNLTLAPRTKGIFDVCHSSVDGNIFQFRGSELDIWNWLKYNGLA